MIKTSKRMLTNKVSSKPVINKYNTILIGDPYCGKSTYINLLAKQESESGSTVFVSDDYNEFEFCLGNKTNNRTIFVVKDTANQERYRSLTQNYYRKVQCVLLIFNKNNEESFHNLNKWHNDIVSYSNNQDSNLSIVLVCLKSRPNKNTRAYEPISLEMIEKFQKEKDFIVGYSEVDLIQLLNLKEPFQILLEHINDRKYVMNGSQFYLNHDFNHKFKNELNEEASSDDEEKCCNIV